MNNKNFSFLLASLLSITVIVGCLGEEVLKEFLLDVPLVGKNFAVEHFGEDLPHHRISVVYVCGRSGRRSVRRPSHCTADAA